MAVYVERALVLSRHVFSESSLVVHVLTPAGGQGSLLAKGAYRPTSRLLLCPRPVRHARARVVRLAAPRARHAAPRRAARAPRAHPQDLRAYRAALSILELLELVVRPAAPEHELFQSSERALQRLDQGAHSPELTLVAWELELLQHLGLAPALVHCAACGALAGSLTRTPERSAFSAGAGGRLCLRCAQEARRAGRRVGTLPVSVLDDAQRLWQDPERPAELTPERLERVRDVVERFLDYHLETRPKSHRSFLSAPNRNAPAATA
jgi:DNA repair protein RecO (recombination protein O)